MKMLDGAGLCVVPVGPRMPYMATYRWVSGNVLWPTRCYKNYCEYSFTTVLGQRPILRFRTIQMSQGAMHIFKQ
jgi:hypothetical protein